MSDLEKILLGASIALACMYLFRNWQYHELKGRHENACKRGTETFNEVSNAIDRMRRDLELRRERRAAEEAKARNENEGAHPVQPDPRRTLPCG